jgi:anti-anti-sigma factor
MSADFAARPASCHADHTRSKYVERVDISTVGGDGAIQVAVHRPRRDVTLVVVSGEVDLCTAPRLREKLLRACGSQNPTARVTTLIVDLSPVTFFAAAGMTTLIEARAAAEKSDRRLILITMVRCVDRVIEITGLSTGFHRVGSLAAALADTATGCEAAV